MRKLDHNQSRGFLLDESGSILVETMIIFPMTAALTSRWGTLGFLTNNSIRLASATSAPARKLARDAPVSSRSLSSTPYAAPGAQLTGKSRLHPAAPEQTIGRV